MTRTMGRPCPAQWLVVLGGVLIGCGSSSSTATPSKPGVDASGTETSTLDATTQGDLSDDSSSVVAVDAESSDAADDTGPSDASSNATSPDASSDATSLDASPDAGSPAMCSPGLDFCAKVTDGGPTSAGTSDAGRDGGSLEGGILAGGPCVDLTTDDANCGACGHACPSHEGCAGSTCQFSKVVFVTSTVYTGGQIKGLDGGDAICAARASAAGLSGTYKAWLADSTGSPSTRLVHYAGPYALIDGTRIAKGWSELTSGHLLAAPNLTEFGATPSGSSLQATQVHDNVFTGSSSNGTQASPAGNCQNWTASGNGAAAESGRSSSTTAWSADIYSLGGCAESAALYCFEQ